MVRDGTRRQEPKTPPQIYLVPAQKGLAKQNKKVYPRVYPTQVSPLSDTSPLQLPCRTQHIGGLSPGPFPGRHQVTRTTQNCASAHLR